MSLDNLTAEDLAKKQVEDSDLLKQMVQRVEALTVSVQEVKESQKPRSSLLGGVRFEQGESDPEDFQDGDDTRAHRDGRSVDPPRGRRRDYRDNRAFDIPGLELEGDVETIQTEFSIIQDSVKKVRLPTSLKVNIGGARGVRRDDQQLVSVLRKNAQYTETLMKLVSQLSEDTVTEGDLKDIFVVLLANIRYIQDKFTAVTLQGTFGKKVAGLYEAIERNPGAYRPRNLETVRAVVGLVAAEQPQQQSRPASYGRGGFYSGQTQTGYSNNYRGGYNPGRFQFQPRGGPRRFGGSFGDPYDRFVRDNHVPANRNWRPYNSVPPNNNQTDGAASDN